MAAHCARFESVEMTVRALLPEELSPNGLRSTWHSSTRAPEHTSVRQLCESLSAAIQVGPTEADSRMAVRGSDLRDCNGRRQLVQSLASTKPRSACSSPQWR